MKRILFILALLWAAPTLAANTAPVQVDAQSAVAGGLGNPGTDVDMGLAGEGDLLVLFTCGQEIVAPSGSGWTTIATDSTGTNVSAAAYWKIADAADESAGLVHLGYESGGKYQAGVLISYAEGTFNETYPIGDHASSAITTTGSGTKSFSVGSVAVANTGVGNYPTGAFPSVVLAGFCGSDNGSGGTWASAYTSAGIASGWAEKADFTFTDGRDGAMAAAAVDQATAVVWGTTVSFSSSISVQYSMVTFNVAGAPPPPTNTPTPLPTSTGTATQTGTVTNTPASTSTATATGTVTSTATITQTPTATGTVTETRTPTQTRTPSNTATHTPTASATRTGTVTSTATRTATITPTVTATRTFTATPVPENWFERAGSGAAFPKTSWTLPEDDGFMACIKRSPGVSEALYCFGAPSPLRWVKDALGNFVRGNPAPHTVAIDSTMTVSLSGREITIGVNPEWHPPLIPEQVTGLGVCLSNAACEVLGAWDFANAAPPSRNGWPLAVADTITAKLEAVTLDGTTQYYTVTGDQAAVFVDPANAETQATVGCLPLRASVSVYNPTTTPLVLAALPSNCNLDVGFVVNGENQLLCSVLQGESRSNFCPGGGPGYVTDDLRGFYVFGDATCAVDRTLVVEVACAASTSD